MDRLDRVPKGADMRKTEKNYVYINNLNFELAFLVILLYGSYRIFFVRWVLIETPDSGPLAIALPLAFKFIGAIQQSSPLTKSHDTAQHRLFYLIRIHPGKAQSLYSYLFQRWAFT